MIAFPIKLHSGSLLPCPLWLSGSFSQLMRLMPVCRFCPGLHKPLHCHPRRQLERCQEKQRKKCAGEVSSSAVFSPSVSKAASSAASPNDSGETWPQPGLSSPWSSEEAALEMEKKRKPPPCCFSLHFSCCPSSCLQQKKTRNHDTNTTSNEFEVQFFLLTTTIQKPSAKSIF